jgi:signal peptide peptidase SppA
MRDLNILSYVGRSLWALTEDKWAEMVPALIRHAKGDKLDAEQLQAFMGGREDKPVTSSKRGAVAIVPIRGVIAHRMEAMSNSSGGASCESLGAMIDQVAGDAGIGTIVYDVDSPGGTVTGVQELAAKMFALRGVKKQIAMVNGMACSAGYWLAAQCDEIVCLPSGVAGSIGVFSAHQDISAALEKEGIKITLIKAGKFKTEGSPFEPLSDEAQAVMQARVDEAYGQFLKDVARGRGVSAADVRKGYGEGRALAAKDAKAAGLIDRIGTMDDTLSRLTGSRANAGGMRAEGEDAELLVAAVNADPEAVQAVTEEALAEADAIAAPVFAEADEMRQRLERI